MMRFENSYATLPQRFFASVRPSEVSEPSLIKLNAALAYEMELDAAGLVDDEIAAIFSGNRILDGSVPLSMAYAGHQFGSFVPKLGDGRAILLGEVIDKSGLRRDVQLKGAGRTPYSRGGDGRAALGPVLREYIVSEAMHALGIPSTRALAAVLTGDQIYRETQLPGAVLTRVAKSHIRVGTFQFFAARSDVEGLRTLADYTIARLYPELKNSEQPYLALLRRVSENQAGLVARWMHVGFIHGVMNTDNTSISGETIDFGPCAFMDTFDPATKYSAIDQTGRYQYQNQPGIAQWNMARFAETLLPLLHDDSEKAVLMANEVVIDFAQHFQNSWLAGMRAKLGLFSEKEDDALLVQQFLDLLQESNADFTLGFRSLCDLADGPENGQAFQSIFSESTQATEWERQWHERIATEKLFQEGRAISMRAANPLYIPRNHLVEAVIRAAIDDANFEPFETLNAVLLRPYDDQGNEAAHYARPPAPDERVLQTFCGT